MPAKNEEKENAHSTTQCGQNRKKWKKAKRWTRYIRDQNRVSQADEREIEKIFWSRN